MSHPQLRPFRRGHVALFKPTDYCARKEGYVELSNWEISALVHFLIPLVHEDRTVRLSIEAFRPCGHNSLRQTIALVTN